MGVRVVRFSNAFEHSTRRVFNLGVQPHDLTVIKFEIDELSLRVQRDGNTFGLTRSC